MNLPARGSAVSQRLALAVLLLLVISLIALIAAPTWWLHRRYDHDEEAFRSKLIRFQEMAVQHGEYAKALEALKARNGRRFYLKATAINLAGAEVQDLVRTAVESNGARLGSIQIGQPRDDGGHRAVPVSVQLVANVQSLQRLLFALETQVPFLFIDSMTLRTAVFRGFRPVPGVEPDINVQLDVSAFIAGSDH